ncbi:MAG: DUF2089 family protein [Phycisphaerae bacterium]|nr:DUF2089 family protein [Phycisphaerae bacterium]
MHPLGQLDRDDLNIVTELVLQGGSIKDVAANFGVSYPTMRARLDRLIDRLKRAVEGRAPDPVTDLLAALVERGELSVASARAIRETVARARTTPSPIDPPPA